MTKSVLITGAAKRIGRQLALDLAADGWAVAVHYARSGDDANGVVAQIEQGGGTAVSLQGDLMDPDVPQRLVSTASERLGGLTCLINNASVFEFDEAGSVTLASWAHHMDVNLRAPVFLAQAFADALPRGVQGNVINILDGRLWKLAPTHFSYTISKSALWTATRTMAQAFAPDIRVNAVGPGPTLPHGGQTQEEFERRNELMLLERGTTPGEVADAVRFVLKARSMTGQMIALDGGQHLLWQTPDMLER